MNNFIKCSLLTLILVFPVSSQSGVLDFFVNIFSGNPLCKKLYDVEKCDIVIISKLAERVGVDGSNSNFYLYAANQTDIASCSINGRTSSINISPIRVWSKGIEYQLNDIVTVKGKIFVCESAYGLYNHFFGIIISPTSKK